MITEAIRVLEMPVGTVAVFHDNAMTALVDGEDKPLKFTNEEERKAAAEKQRAEFEAEVAEAKARAEQAKAAAQAAEEAKKD